MDAFEDVMRISLALATSMPKLDILAHHPVFEQALSLLTVLVRRVDDRKGDRLTISWDPSHWLSSLLACLDIEVSPTAWTLVFAR